MPSRPWTRALHPQAVRERAADHSLAVRFSVVCVAIAGLMATDLAAQSLSPSGYLGGINLPVARTLPAGSAALSLVNNNPEFKDPHQRGAFGSANLGLGLLPGLELVGRLSFAGDPHCSMYAPGCQAGPRDLSVSAKAAYAWPGASQTWLALGATDYGGAATRYRSRYAVATHDFGVLDVTMGVAQAQSRSALLDGVFGGALVRLTPHVSAVLESSSAGSRAGAQVRYPLGGGWQVQAHASQGFGLDSGLQRAQLGLGFSWQPSQSREGRSGGASARSQLSLLIQLPLSQAIEAMGHRDVSVQGNVITLEPTQGRSDRLQAITPLLELMSQHPQVLQAAWSDWVVQVSLWGRIAQSFRVSRACLQTADARPTRCVDSSHSDEQPLTRPRSWTDGLRWAAWAPQFEVGLGLRSAVGTEYGLFDYSAALELGWESRLAPGLVWQGFGSGPLARSDDYQAERVFAADRHWTRQIEQSLLSYWIPVNTPVGKVHMQGSAGQMSLGWTGQQMDVLWSNASGRLRAFFSMGRYEYVNSSKPDAQQTLASLRYSVLPGRWHLDVQGGRYFGSDRGVRLSSVHWSGPLRTSLYLLRSGNEQRWDRPDRSFAGFEISFPLDFWSGSWAGMSVRGRDRWTYRLETKVGEDDNYITRGYGRVQQPRHGLLTSISDFDRHGPADTRARALGSSALH